MQYVCLDDEKFDLAPNTHVLERFANVVLTGCSLGLFRTGKKNQAKPSPEECFQASPAG